MAAGFKSAAEFRFCKVERAESRGARLWIRNRCESWIRRGCESIDRCFATVLSGTESFSVGALGGESVAIHRKSFGIDDTALIGELGIKSDRSVWQPTDSERKYPTVVSERKHAAIVAKRGRQPFIIVGRRQPFVWRKRLQRWRRRRFVNASGEFARISESRGRWRQGWWRSSLSHTK
jgi:hypothetical protein